MTLQFHIDMIKGLSIGYRFSTEVYQKRIDGGMLQLKQLSSDMVEKHTSKSAFLLIIRRFLEVYLSFMIKRPSYNNLSAEKVVGVNELLNQKRLQNSIKSFFAYWPNTPPVHRWTLR